MYIITFSISPTNLYKSVRGWYTNWVEARLTLRPGQKGTKKLLTQYGERLIYVRYRYDEQKMKRYKTVELIVEEADWIPPSKRPAGDTIVDIKVEWGEADVARQVKNAGGIWNAQKKVWELRYDQVVKCGLANRIVGEYGYLNLDARKSI